MLQHPLKSQCAVAVSTESAQRAVNVIAFLDWETIPMCLSQPNQGFRMSLLQSKLADEALSHLHDNIWEPDVLIVDEDFFGSPEAAADACLQIRRSYPEVRIIALESEMWEGASVLSMLGISQVTLPSGACAQTVLRSLRQLH